MARLTMASATPEVSVSQNRFETPAASSPSPLETPSSSTHDKEGTEGNTQNRKSITQRKRLETKHIGVVCAKAASKFADIVTAYFNRNGTRSTLYPCDDIERFQTSVEGLSPSAILYLLVDEDLHQLFHTQYADYTQLFAEIVQSGKKMYVVSYLEDEEDFKEVKYKLPRAMRENIIPKEKFVSITDGHISITENDNMVIQIGDNNVFREDTTTGDFTGTQIGGNSTFRYRSESSVTGYVLTIKTPKADHQLDVSVKKHIDDNRDYINVGLEDLHAVVTSTELGSVVIHVEVEEGARIGPDWLKKLIITILPENIISRLPQGTRMYINIQASIPLVPFDVDIFDMKVEQTVAMDTKNLLVEDMVKLSSGPLVDLEFGSYLIHFAAIRGMVHIVKELLAAGVDANQRTNSRNTPLHLAAKSGNVEIVDMLIKKGGNINAQNKDGATPLDMARKADNVECQKHLWIAINNQDVSPLEADFRLKSLHQTIHSEVLTTRSVLLHQTSHFMPAHQIVVDCATENTSLEVDLQAEKQRFVAQKGVEKYHHHNRGRRNAIGRMAPPRLIRI